MNADRESVCIFSAGGMGCGKTTDLKERLARLKADRIIVVDPDGEYEGWGYLHDNPADLYRATAFPTFKARIRPSIDRRTAEAQFDVVCQIVRWHAAPEPGQAKPSKVGPVVLVVDELADFVGPSFRDTPESYQWVIKRGRKYGVYFFGASQRPAQIDKTLFDLASCIRTGRLNNPDSHRTMADALNVPIEHVRSLIDHEYIERNKISGQLTLPKRLQPAPTKPAAKPRPSRSK